ncbi:Gfo/Idh/MocA family protein [Pelagovum pacificum]|uniref:Gfo/Idh/MocA family protein n=1 Tax=Pelagovum pacificum TaxID=2588711 RepID=UPI0018E36FFE|nr:Gfo/Idh/MocA family oxidoreductase [Pelagovum pacificum]QQA44253.1 Gfo/Idh/MocA family oxidoreductase [Pelagovum pacificum]
MTWGLIGASRIAARAIVPALRAEGQVITSVAAGDATRATAFAEEHAIAGTHSDYASLLAGPGIDAVYISLTNELHADWTIRALRSGKHVLCEKPLALAERDAAAIVSAESACGRRVMEAFCHLYHPAVVDLAAAMESGALGEVLTLQGDLSFPLEDDEDFRWSAARGGGAAADLGCYLLCLASLLTGHPATEISVVRRPRGEVDGSVTALFRSGDIHCTITAGLLSGPHQGLRVTGTGAIAELNQPVTTRGRSVELKIGDDVRTYPPHEPYRHMVRHFVDAITHGAPILFDSAASLAQANALEQLRGKAMT